MQTLETISTFFTKMAETLDFPDEILIEIFSRLPSKSVGKFRCLSKSWLFHLSTPQFITSHQSHQTYQQQNLILITQSLTLHTTTPPFDYSTKIDLQDYKCSQVVGCCNGLVLLANNKEELCLINPLTTQKVNIPDSADLPLDKGLGIQWYGFGYDIRNNDYKIVKLSFFDFTGHFRNILTSPDVSNNIFVSVYSAKMGVWKRFGIFPYHHLLPENAPGAFVNGTIHWLAQSYCDVGTHSLCTTIAAFDLATEVFYEIKVPFILNSLDSNLVVRGGCLCVIPSYSGLSHDVWTMEEYGLVESWKKFTIGVNDVWMEFQLLCFVGEEHVLCEPEEDQDSLIVYNVREGTMNELVVHGVPSLFRDVGVFVESLVVIG